WRGGAIADGELGLRGCLRGKRNSRLPALQARSCARCAKNAPQIHGILRKATASARWIMPIAAGRSDTRICLSASYEVVHWPTSIHRLVGISAPDAAPLSTPQMAGSGARNSRADAAGFAPCENEHVMSASRAVNRLLHERHDSRRLAEPDDADY